MTTVVGEKKNRFAGMSFDDSDDEVKPQSKA